jgi:hypothetical protein
MTDFNDVRRALTQRLRRWTPESPGFAGISLPSLGV